MSAFSKDSLFSEDGCFFSQCWRKVLALCPYPRRPKGLHTPANWHLQCEKFLFHLWRIQIVTSCLCRRSDYYIAEDVCAKDMKIFDQRQILSYFLLITQFPLDLLTSTIINLYVYVLQPIYFKLLLYAKINKNLCTTIYIQRSVSSS